MATLNLRTPNGYDGSRGTSKKQGIVRLATTPEALDGVADNVAITPSQARNVGVGLFEIPPVLGDVIPNIVNSTGFRTREGANAKQGVAVLVAGTATIANTSITATSRIFLTGQNLGTVAAPSAYGVSARNPGASFTILARQNTDTSTIAYEIFEPGA